MRTIGAMAFFVVGWLFVAGCGGDVAAGSNAQTLCAHDVDCGGGRYCTRAGVCRADCVDDRECIELMPGALLPQCNVHGRCIEPVLDAGASPDAPPASSDGASVGDASTEVSGP